MCVTTKFKNAITSFLCIHTEMVFGNKMSTGIFHLWPHRSVLGGTHTTPAVPCPHNSQDTHVCWWGRKQLSRAPELPSFFSWHHTVFLHVYPWWYYAMWCQEKKMWSSGQLFQAHAQQNGATWVLGKDTNIILNIVTQALSLCTITTMYCTCTMCDVVSHI